MGSAEDTKERILKGAFDAVMKSGLPPLSFDAVASEAGMSRQRIRYHFKTADELMVGLCDWLAAAYRAALTNNAARLEGADRLAKFLDFYFDFLDGTAKPKDDQAYDAMMSLAAGSPRIRDNLRAQYTLLGQVLSHEFQVAHPQLTTRASEELSYLFVCLMYGHWKMVASLGISPKHNRVTRIAMDRLVRDFVSHGETKASGLRVWAAEQ